VKRTQRIFKIFRALKPSKVTVYAEQYAICTLLRVCKTRIRGVFTQCAI